MKNTSHDFHADNDNLEIALFTANRLTEDEAWTDAHRYTIEQAHMDANRMPVFIAMIDYQEMINFRRLPPEPAHLICLAEMERMAH